MLGVVELYRQNMDFPDKDVHVRSSITELQPPSPLHILVMQASLKPRQKQKSNSCFFPSRCFWSPLQKGTQNASPEPGHGWWGHVLNTVLTNWNQKWIFKRKTWVGLSRKRKLINSRKLSQRLTRQRNCNSDTYRKHLLKYNIQGNDTFLAATEKTFFTWWRAPKILLW